MLLNTNHCVFIAMLLSRSGAHSWAKGSCAQVSGVGAGVEVWWSSWRSFLHEISEPGCIAKVQVKHHGERWRRAPLFVLLLKAQPAGLSCRVAAGRGKGRALSPLGIAKQLRPPLSVAALEVCPLATWWGAPLHYVSWSGCKTSSALQTPGKLCFVRAAVSDCFLFCL